MESGDLETGAPAFLFALSSAIFCCEAVMYLEEKKLQGFFPVMSN
jgi:hypothetical protein